MGFYEDDLILKEMNRLHMEFLQLAFVQLDTSWNATVSSPYTRIYAVTSGEGKVSFGNGDSLPLLPGNVYIIPSNCRFHYSCDRSLEKLYCHISLLGYDGYDILSVMGKPLVLDGKADAIKKALNSYEKREMSSSLYLKEWFYSLVTEAIERYGISLGKIEVFSPPIKKALRFIRSHCNNSLSVTAVAEETGLSVNTVKKQFKSQVGVSLGKYISDQVMMEAERRLRSEDTPIHIISEELGFCDQFYFSRCFSKQYGISPSQYRKLK